MELLVAYDISTESLAGEIRLRKIAKVCEAYGQRVQKSVFECLVNEVQFELLKQDVLRVIDPHKDSVRIYRLREPRRIHTWVAGRKQRYDLHGPLIVVGRADPE